LLLIAGEGPAVGPLRAAAGAAGVAASVRFLGYFDRDTELLDCYRAADLFVFASLTETQGLVLLEAMAQGVPVVAVPRMGTVDILSPQRGCRHAPLEEAGFALLASQLIGDRNALAALGAEAAAYAKEWSSAAQARKLADLYAGLKGNSRSPAELALQMTG
jgi:1,2-diacylglycerol 3-alpha-glucosyltransferase